MSVFDALFAEACLRPTFDFYNGGQSYRLCRAIAGPIVKADSSALVVGDAADLDPRALAAL